jgi:hypothetical protein
MSAPYAWLVVTDHLDGSDADVTGPWGASEERIARLREAAAAGPERAGEYPDAEWFQMLDDDGELYYTGVRAGESQYDDGFEPLDDFGKPNAGCTEIRYLNTATGEWVTL